METPHKRWRPSSFQIIMLGFLGVILAGSLLLTLPIATKIEGSANFFDALFTATSAVCVTGLVIHDTATFWSGFGQGIILSLIQIGGVGVISIAAAMAILSGRKIGLMQRSTIQEAIAAPQVGGVVRLTGFILKMTIICEVVGMMVMAPVFCREFGLGKGLWYALFHSVSAFCNAGFDLMGTKEVFSSLTYFSDNICIQVSIMLLIITGGIGFVTWDDFRRNGIRFHRFRMQSKVILFVTLLLILLPALYFYFIEFSDFSLKARILNSLFQSVTPRTAGFNTVDLTQISETGIAIMIILMLIGAAPGSTAGGMKTTTLAVIIACAISVFCRREDIHFYGRRVSEHVVRNAVAIALLYITLSITGAMIISLIENLPLLDCMFETASAIGTVGLSLGITPQLNLISRAILIILMFFGRVGGLTLIFATLSGSHTNAARLPQEKITVG